MLNFALTLDIFFIFTVGLVGVGVVGSCFVGILATSLTVTLQVLANPFDNFAVIIVTPFAFPVTFPIPSTVATFLSDELHVTILLLAFVGLTVATNLLVFPFSIVIFVLFNVIPVASIVHFDSIYFFQFGFFWAIFGTVDAAIYSNSLNVSLESITPSPFISPALIYICIIYFFFCQNPFCMLLFYLWNS